VAEPYLRVMTTYYITRSHWGLPDLEVDYEGNPPCLWCGEPVPPPGSMDGPLVCGACDSGVTQDADGSYRKWTDAEYRERWQHRKRALEEIIKANEAREQS